MLDGRRRFYELECCIFWRWVDATIGRFAYMRVSSAYTWQNQRSAFLSDFVLKNGRQDDIRNVLMRCQVQHLASTLQSSQGSRSAPGAAFSPADVKCTRAELLSAISRLLAASQAAVIPGSMLQQTGISGCTAAQALAVSTATAIDQAAAQQDAAKNVLLFMLR
jgi:hypothetical protein